MSNALRRSVVLALAAALGGSMLAVVPPRPQPAAAADPPSREVLVVNQDNTTTGCIDYPQEVVTANPFTGARTDVLGRPSTIVGQLSDAKPIANNRKVVALWAGRDSTRRGGIGVYNRDTESWEKSFTLLPEFKTGEGNAHSVAYLPDGYFAVALVGAWAGTGSGWVVILSPTGAYVDKEPLSSAHGVEWDARTKRIVAVGYDKAAVFSYGLNTDHMIAPATPAPTHLHTLPTVGGHDLRRRRANGGVEFFVTTFDKTYRYNPDATTKFQPAGGMTKTNTAQSPLEDHIKSIDEGWDGEVTYNQYHNDRFYFLNGRVVSGTFCYDAYKTGRWLFDKGARVQPEDTPDTPTTGCTSTAFNTTYTLGSGMNPWWIEVYTTTEVDRVDVIFNGGEHYFPLVRQSSTRWGASPPYAMAPGQWLRFVARRADGASAASTDFQWQVGQPQNTVPGWCTAWTLGAKNEWWVEVDVATEATSVEVKVQNGTFTALDRMSSTKWGKSVHAPPGSDVVFRAYKADGARAYSPFYVW